MKSPVQVDGRASQQDSFYIEADFYDMASALREELDRQAINSAEGNRTIANLEDARCEHQFHFLTAGAQRIFSRALVDELIKELSAWGGDVLGTSHVSTPQLRVYFSGCWRDLLRDDVSACWHYLLSLTRATYRRQPGQIKLLTGNISSDEIGIDRFVTLHLEFNQLLVHDTSKAYEIRPSKKSVHPLEGEVLLDGYLW